MNRTQALYRVAVALMDDPNGDHYGYPLGRATHLRSGVLYPLLGRLLEQGWLVDHWEDAKAAHAEKRPPRRFYRLTKTGLRELGALAAEAPADVRTSFAHAKLIGLRGV